MKMMFVQLLTFVKQLFCLVPCSYSYTSLTETNMYKREEQLKAHYNVTLDYFSPVQVTTVSKLLDMLGVNLRGCEIHDLGCGTGWFTDWARSVYNAKVTGVDYAHERIKLARRRYPLSTYIESSVYDHVESLPLTPDPNTFFTAWDVLEHLEDPMRLISACAHRGTLIGTIPKDMPYVAHLGVYNDKTIATLNATKIVQFHYKRDYYLGYWKCQSPA